jgi:hypothetical protein
MSSCAPLDRLMTTLRIRLPGAPDATLKVEMFNVMDAFFRRTNVWRYETDVTLTENTTEYPIFPPAETNLVRVMAVTHKGSPVSPITGAGSAASQRGRLSPDEMAPDGDPTYYPDELQPSGTGGVFHYSLYYPTYIAITLAPDENARQQPLRMIMALTLAQGCLECECDDWSVPDWMYDRYFDDWLNGVQASMMAMIAKPWSNPTMAQYHGKVFRQKMAFAKQEAMRGFVFDAPRWRFPRGGWP